jgi:hypothetical protein
MHFRLMQHLSVHRRKTREDLQHRIVSGRKTLLRELGSTLRNEAVTLCSEYLCYVNYLQRPTRFLEQHREDGGYN